MATNRITLPPELIQEICSHFHRDETMIDYAQDWLPTQRQLAAVCRVSKAFYNLAQPYLYRQIHVSLDNLTGPGYLSLLRTLISRPDLRRRVRELKLDVAWSEVHRENISQADMAVFLEITRQWPWNKPPRASRHSTWANCEERTRETLVDLLLAHLEDLSIVHLSVRKTWHDEAVVEPSDLFVAYMSQRLTSLHIYPDDQGVVSCQSKRVELSMISNFFEYFSSDLGQLVALRCDLLSEYLRPDLFCGLQGLSLYDVVFYHDMEYFMNACDGLRRFAYTSGIEVGLGVTADDWLKVLEQYSDTLVDLSLCINDPDTTNIPLYGYESFHKFTKLEKLDVFSLDFVDGNNRAFSTLPKSLKHITLCYWTSRKVNDDVYTVAKAAAEGFFPELETLEVQFCGDRSVARRQLARFIEDMAALNLGYL